ncbi:MAG: hypothetical protein ACOYON_13345, partial [Fimbriimonas sp.]
MKEPITLESLAAELSQTKRELRRSRLITAVAAFVGLVGIAGMTAPQAFAQGPGPTTAQVNAALLLLTGRVTTAESTLTTVQTSVTTANNDIASLQSAQVNQASSISTLSTQGTVASNRLDALENKTQYLLVSGTDTIFRGTNLYVQSGLGSTSGELRDQNGFRIRSATTNGLGNLVIGYNENQNGFWDRSGSHNLVLGENNGYSSYSGIVVGRRNSITAPNASIYGGQNSGAFGVGSVVFGGSNNTAGGDFAVVAGGDSNAADGPASL